MSIKNILYNLRWWKQHFSEILECLKVLDLFYTMVLTTIQNMNQHKMASILPLHLSAQNIYTCV